MSAYPTCPEMQDPEISDLPNSHGKGSPRPVRTGTEMLFDLQRARGFKKRPKYTVENNNFGDSAANDPEGSSTHHSASLVMAEGASSDSFVDEPTQPGWNLTNNAKPVYSGLTLDMPLPSMIAADPKLAAPPAHAEPVITHRRALTSRVRDLLKDLLKDLFKA